ncbi:MAG: N-formylglutamate amidohydrolase [Pseudomonadota bacterium]
MTYESFSLIDSARDRHGFVFICDHASNEIPASFDNLGLPVDRLQQHIAYDIGAAETTRRLAAHFGAAAVLSRFSRLLVDPNRAADRRDVIPEESDGVVIPGNIGLTEAARQARFDAFYTPYHDAVAAAFKAVGEAGLFISVHSFTPEMSGEKRPWEIGVLWNHDAATAAATLGALRALTPFAVGDNEPYTGKLYNHTMDVRAAPLKARHVTLEIRQDLIADADGVGAVAEALAPVLEAVAEG